MYDDVGLKTVKEDRQRAYDRLTFAIEITCSNPEKMLQLIDEYSYRLIKVDNYVQRLNNQSGDK